MPLSYPFIAVYGVPAFAAVKNITLSSKSSKKIKTKPTGFVFLMNRKSGQIINHYINITNIAILILTNVAIV